jgi:hypothetical protein
VREEAAKLAEVDERQREGDCCWRSRDSLRSSLLLLDQ